MKIEFGVNLQQVLFTTGQNSILRGECGKSSSIFYSTKNTFAFYFSIQKQNIALRELGNSVNKKVGCNLESTEIRQKVQRSEDHPLLCLLAVFKNSIFSPPYSGFLPQHNYRESLQPLKHDNTLLT